MKTGEVPVGFLRVNFGVLERNRRLSLTNVFLVGS